MTNRELDDIKRRLKEDTKLTADYLRLKSTAPPFGYALMQSIADRRTLLEMLKDIPRTTEGDGIDRLCKALYGRDPRPSDYLGGSNAKMLHDAVGALADADEDSCDLEALQWVDYWA